MKSNNFYIKSINSLAFYSVLLFLLPLLTSCNGKIGTKVISNYITEKIKGEFKFIVFGDFNGGGCDRNGRVKEIIKNMASVKNIAFYISTGDLIDGYILEDDSTTCFASNPATQLPNSFACTSRGLPAGNLAEIMSPIKDRTPVADLEASFYPVIGNHDDGWGKWYPDPCGDGICDFLLPLTPDTYVKHPHGDFCNKTKSTSAYSKEFYYSFTYKNSYFIILRINNDIDTLISSCQSHTGHPNCTAYCSDPLLLDDSERNNSCWSDHGQYKWFLSELEKSKTYQNVFVFSHAVALAGGSSHTPFNGAKEIRKVSEAAGVDIYFNGHNHAYQRTKAIRGNQLDSSGTVYITTGVAGATTDHTFASWFTAATYAGWIHPEMNNKDNRHASYIVISIKDNIISGETFSPYTQSTAVDTFSH